jgi:hypothetical protein
VAELKRGARRSWATAVLLATLLVPKNGYADQPDPVSRVPIAARDQEVLDVVLSDLFSYVAEDSPVAIRGAAPLHLSIAPASVDWPGSIEAVLCQGEAGKWKQLSRTQRAALRQAAAHLVSRVERKRGFRDFKSHDARVQIYQQPPAGEEQSVEHWFNRPILASPPGFSTDGSLGIVVLSIPKDIHSASATYVLERAGSGWSIVMRQFVYYL